MFHIVLITCVIFYADYTLKWNARHFGTGTIRNQDTSAPVRDISAPGQFDTRTIRHLCEIFRHQDSSAPGQFDTCVFFFDFTYKTSNSLDSDVLISFF